jgi:hypothetical protein
LISLLYIFLLSHTKIRYEYLSLVQIFAPDFRLTRGRCSEVKVIEMECHNFVRYYFTL